MFTRHLSLWLGLLLFASAAAAVILLVLGPQRVEQQTIDLLEAQQELLAEQGAARLAQSLADLEVRLTSSVAQLDTELHSGKAPEQLRDTLRRIGHPEDVKSGVTLLVHDVGGQVLAVDPRASDELTADITAQLHSADDISPVWMVLDSCKDCVSDHQRILVATELGDDRLLAASVDLDTLAERVLEPLAGERGFRTSLTTNTGRVLYTTAQGSNASATEWVRARAPVASTDWHVEVAAPRSLIAPEVRKRASMQLIASFTILALLLVGLVLLGLMKRREHREHLERVRALAHQDKLATLGMLAASAAHEIRNAIAAAKLQLKVAAAEADAGRVEHIEAATRSVERLGKLASNLAGYAGKGDEKPQRFDLTNASREALDVVSPKLDQKVEVNLDADTQVYVTGRQSALVQVIVNLVLNAYDAASEQERIAIDVAVEREADNAVVTVTDNGPGIDPGLLERIFEPFFSTKLADSSEGTGLGLWLSSQIIQQHGGTIDAENVEGGGARFTVSLPLERDDELVAVAPEAASGEGVDMRGDNARRSG